MNSNQTHDIIKMSSNDFVNFISNSVYGQSFKFINDVMLRDYNESNAIDKLYMKTLTLFKTACVGSKPCYQDFSKEHLSIFVKTISKHDVNKLIILNDSVLHRALSAGKCITLTNTISWVFPKKQINTSIVLASEIDKLFKQFLVVLSSHQVVEANKESLLTLLRNEKQPYCSSNTNI